MLREMRASAALSALSTDSKAVLLMTSTLLASRVATVARRTWRVTMPVSPTVVTGDKVAT